MIWNQLEYKVPHCAYNRIDDKIKHNICHFQFAEVSEYAVDVYKGDQAGG